VEAVLLVGIPACGKTTFYVERFLNTHVRISLDMLRTRHRESVFAAACLAVRQPFVVDDTNFLRSQRAAFIEPARAAGFRVVGYELRCDVKEALRRNRARPAGRVVPPAGVVAAFKRLQRPSFSEGFDALFVVESGPDGFAVREQKKRPSTAG